jgi:hypothetical protein
VAVVELEEFGLGMEWNGGGGTIRNVRFLGVINRAVMLPTFRTAKCCAWRESGGSIGSLGGHQEQECQEHEHEHEHERERQSVLRGAVPPLFFPSEL